jgi:5-methylcytosine-specific restriction protein A
MPWSRTSRQSRGYGRRWEIARDRALRRDRYLCQPCAARGFVTEAKAVDHIVPKSKGGGDELDNLQAICPDCHRRKTLEESQSNLRRVGVDGWPV